jgi:DNA adenine methylase
MEITKPFLKWVGGKTQILEEVLRAFPRNMVHYHEPFLGGGSVLLGLLSAVKAGSIRVTGTIYASDVNSNLIALYKNIQTTPDALIAEVNVLKREFESCRTLGENEKANRKAKTREEALSSPEAYYFWIRSRFNAMTKETRTTPTASAMLIFMNKTCFRGVYREGPNGFNVPYGNYKSPAILDEAHIRAVSALIQNVVFTCCSFKESLKRPAEGDFVYLDPPYAPETDTSFTSYTADGFTGDDHKSLFTLCTVLNTKSVKMLMSNADVALVKTAFPSPAYTTKIILCRRAIHSKKPDAKTNEVLITN